MKAFQSCPLPPPAYLEVNPVSCEQELKDLEALFLNDYHESTWDQVFFEFGSRGACVWTTGNGCVAVAGVKSEFPILALTLNDTHAQVVTHFVDCCISMAVREVAAASSKEAWFRTYAEEAKKITKKMKALCSGANSGDDEDEEKPKKKPKKDDKKKKEDTKDSCIHTWQEGT